MSRADANQLREHYINVNRIVLQKYVKTGKILEQMKEGEVFAHGDEILQEIEAMPTNISMMRKLLDNLTFLGPKAHRTFWRAVAIEHSDVMENQLKKPVPRELYLDPGEELPIAQERLPDEPQSSVNVSHFPTQASDREPPQYNDVVSGQRSGGSAVQSSGTIIMQETAGDDLPDNIEEHDGDLCFSQDSSLPSELRARPGTSTQPNHPEEGRTIGNEGKKQANVEDVAYSNSEISLILGIVAAVLVLCFIAAYVISPSS